MPLRRRVVVGFVAVATVLVLTNVVLWSTFHSFLLARVDRQLAEVDTPLRNHRIFRGDRGRLDPGAGEAFSEYFLAVGYPGDDTLVRLSSGLDAEDRPPPRLRRSDLLDHLTPLGRPLDPFTAPAESGSGAWRLVAVQIPPDGRMTVVGLSLDEMHATLQRIRAVQLAGTLAVLLALAGVSWWMVRLGVHPMTAMTRTAERIAAGDLSLRVEHPDERTEAGRLGAALNAMLARIEHAFRQKEASEARVRRFAADASHELRTPLTSIQGYAELWRAGGLRSEEEVGEAMRRMEQEARRMAALVEDLLLLARLDQHRPLDRAPVRLDEIVADGVGDARAVEPDRPIDLSVQPVTVLGDEMRLRQVVGNLLANARVHTPPGTPVHVVVRPADGVARLEVADEGPGLPAEVAQRVFERFFRADPSRTRGAGGTGLGLAIVAAVAEAHGGRVGVESAPGRGSRFLVELPLAAAPAGDGGRQRERAPLAGEEIPTPPGVVAP